MGAPVMSDPKHPVRSRTMQFFAVALPAVGGVVDYLCQNADTAKVLLTPGHFALFTLGIGAAGCFLRTITKSALSLSPGQADEQGQPPS
jgi:hypothetical protein